VPPSSLALALVLARAAQYVAATVLFGSPLFFLYGLPNRGDAAAVGLAWPKPVLAGASALLFAGAVVALGATTANMTGRAADAYRPGAWLSVVTGADFGPVMAGRIGLALAALVITLLSRPSLALWTILAAVGGAALASFAWTGHGASDEGVAGAVHLAGDVAHLLAAGVWLGALAVLAILLFSSGPKAGRRAGPAALQSLHGGLRGFSGIGSAAVAALLASGLLNSWFLVGVGHVRDLLSTTYGLLLCGKVAIFAGMLGLAGLNRFKLTPALARSLAAAAPDATLRALRLSIAFETAAGVAVLVLVGALGTVAPPSAMG
jgi:putative copper resistance protein D